MDAGWVDRFDSMLFYAGHKGWYDSATGCLGADIEVKTRSQ
jgi:hypothetical protein